MAKAKRNGDGEVFKISDFVRHLFTGRMEWEAGSFLSFIDGESAK